MSNESIDNELGAKLSQISIQGINTDRLKGTVVPINMLIANNQIECPFTWDLPHVDLDTTSLKVKACDTYHWIAFVANLTFAWDYAKYQNFDDAMVSFENCKQMLSNLRYPEVMKNAEPGFHHVLSGSLYFLLLKQNKLSDSKSFENIKPFEELDNISKAAVCGIKAAVWMEMGKVGSKNSIECSKKAIELNPQQAEWHYHLGKGLGRLRRRDKSCWEHLDYEKEVRALKKALELSESGAYYVYLAQCYREIARDHFISNTKPRLNFCNEMNKLAKECYRKALELAPHNPHINLRCALGFLKFPKKFRDIEVAGKCMQLSLSMMPDNLMVNHVAGQYYEHTGDYELSVEYYKKGSCNFTAHPFMDYIRLKSKLDKNYDPLPEMEEAYQNESLSDDFKHQLLCRFGFYYYTCKKDIKKAFEYWKKVMDDDIKCRYLMMDCNIFANGKLDSIYDILYEESSKALQKPDCSAQDRVFFANILSFYEKNDIKVNMLAATRTKTSIRSQSRGNSYGSGRISFGGDSRQKAGTSNSYGSRRTNFGGDSREEAGTSNLQTTKFGKSNGCRKGRSMPLFGKQNQQKQETKLSWRTEPRSIPDRSNLKLHPQHYSKKQAESPDESLS